MNGSNMAAGDSIGEMETMDGVGGRSGYTLREGETLGQYRIVRPLGRGGMGEVYEAENLVNRKRVALKILPRGAIGGRFVARFRVESRVMMDLEHPGLVRVHHAGQERGLYYLTMDLVLGPDGEPRTLEDRLREEGGKLPETEVREIALQVCEALQYANTFRGQGVVHRDLKPANVLLGENGRPRVADFGLARVVGPEYLKTVIERSISLTLAGEVSLSDEETEGGEGKKKRPSSSARALLGTYDYMAPEQKAGGEITPRTDIYALGVMLYRMLTGYKPEGAYEPPSKFGAARGWDGIVRRCLQRDPALRFGSAGELREAIAKTARKALPGKLILAAAAAILLAAGVWWRFGGAPETAGPAPAPQAEIVPPVQETGEPTVSFRVSPPGAGLSIFGDRGLLAQGKTDEKGNYAVRVPDGRYEIEAQLDGYEFHRQYLTVEGDTALELDLVPLRGGLTVLTTPGAEVIAVGSAGDLRLGQAGDDGRLNYDRLVEGDYTLKFSHPDYREAEARVSIRKDRPQEVRRELRGKPGSAYVSASPEAEVWVEGELKGNTGEEISELEPGTRRFEVKKSGYRTERFSLEIPPNRMAERKVLGNLARESGSARIEGEVPDYAREHFGKAEKRVRIGSSAWKKVAELPYREEGLACGPAAVSLEAAGYEITRAPAGPVTISDGGTAEVKFELAPKPARLKLTGGPAGLRVEVNGADGKLSPNGTLEAPFLRPLKLAASAPGYAAAVIAVPALDPGSERTQSISLEKQRYPDLKSPWENSLGMELLPVPGTGVLFAKYETRVKDFRAFVNDRAGNRNYNYRSGEQPYILKDDKWKKRGWEYGWDKPGFSQTDDHPVTCVSWEDAQAFCEWLTRKERDEKKIGPDQEYRLPTDKEWSVAVGLKDRLGVQERGGDIYPWSGGRGKWPPPKGAGNYAGEEAKDRDWPSNYVVIGGYNDGDARTARVGKFSANAHGLYDLGGNVWEWCADLYSHSLNRADFVEELKEAGWTDDWIKQNKPRVLRGGSWSSGASGRLLSSCRDGGAIPGGRSDARGFRVVLGFSSP